KPLELDEHALLILVGDAWAPVDDPELDPVAERGRGDQRRLARGGVAKRVLREVHHDALEDGGVGADGRQQLGDLYGDVPACRAQVVERQGDDLIETGRPG